MEELFVDNPRSVQLNQIPYIVALMLASSVTCWAADAPLLLSGCIQELRVPPYPAIAHHGRTTGSTSVRLMIDESGDGHVLSVNGPARFRDSLVELVEHSSFTLGCAGQIFDLRVVFELYNPAEKGVDRSPVILRKDEIVVRAPVPEITVATKSEIGVGQNVF